MRYAQIPALLVIASLVGILGIFVVRGETLLEKKMTNGGTLKISKQSHSWQNITNRVQDTSRSESIGESELVLTIQNPSDPKPFAIWTNTSLIIPTNSQTFLVVRSSNQHYALDAIEFHGVVHLIYKMGGWVFIEPINTTEPKAERESFCVARDTDFRPSIWTNAAFNITTNDILILVARSSTGATLTWQFRDDEWDLVHEKCEPENDRMLAYDLWCKRRLVSNRWALTKKHTLPLPGIEKHTNAPNGPLK